MSEKIFKSKRPTIKDFSWFIFLAIYVIVMAILVIIANFTCFHKCILVFASLYIAIYVTTRVKYIYILSFYDTEITACYAGIFGDSLCHVKYEYIEVVYKTYSRKPDKNTLLIRNIKDKNVVTMLKEGQNWQLKDVINEFSRHPEVRIIRVPMK